MTARRSSGTTDSSCGGLAESALQPKLNLKLSFRLCLSLDPSAGGEPPLTFGAILPPALRRVGSVVELRARSGSSEYSLPRTGVGRAT